MNLFGYIRKTSAKDETQSATLAAVSVELRAADAVPAHENSTASDMNARPRLGRRTGRTKVYAARVRDGFKGEILALQAELQLEHQNMNRRARKVTEGELLELMLDALKTARRNGGAIGYAVPIANDVWQAVHEIARRLQCSPADVVEQLVVQKIDQLGLLPRR